MHNETLLIAERGTFYEQRKVTLQLTASAVRIQTVCQIYEQYTKGYRNKNGFFFWQHIYKILTLAHHLVKKNTSNRTDHNLPAQLMSSCTIKTTTTTTTTTTTIFICTLSCLISNYRKYRVIINLEYWLPGMTIGASGARRPDDISIK